MPGSRFTDLDRPPLSETALRRALVDDAAGAGALARLDVVAEAGSTNADLLARAGDPDGWPHRSLLVAEHQQAGRGRLDRTWVTPPRAALTLSLLLRPAAPRGRWGWLPLLAGVAVVRALREGSGVDAGLKWPNDVLLPPRPGLPAGERDGAGKVAGLLAQVEGGAVVLGIGLNVTSTEDELPPGGTSLRLAGAARELCVTLGQAVRVERPGGDLVGEAEGLDDDGRLLVRERSGALTAVAAGDVVHLRATT